MEVFHDDKKWALLQKFRDMSRNQPGIHDQGCLLTDERRYLDFTPMLNILGDKDRVAALIDDWIAREILLPGVHLQVRAMREHVVVFRRKPNSELQVFEMRYISTVFEKELVRYAGADVVLQTRRNRSSAARA